MPGLDRRIVVRVVVTGVNDFGEYTETTTDFPMWAGVADLSAFDVEQQGGQFTNRLRKWMVRWRSEIAAADIGTSQLRVIDDGLEYNVTNLVRQQDGRARRRMMLIEGVAIP